MSVNVNLPLGSSGDEYPQNMYISEIINVSATLPTYGSIANQKMTLTLPQEMKNYKWVYVLIKGKVGSSVQTPEDPTIILTSPLAGNETPIDTIQGVFGNVSKKQFQIKIQQLYQNYLFSSYYNISSVLIGEMIYSYNPALASITFFLSDLSETTIEINAMSENVDSNESRPMYTASSAMIVAFY